MEFITLPVSKLEELFDALNNKLDQTNKRLDLMSRGEGNQASDYDYKTVKQIAELLSIKESTVNQQLLYHKDEIEVLQNGRGGKKMVNFTHYRKVLSNSTL